MNAREQVEQFKRQLLAELLEQCDKEQRELWSEWLTGTHGDELMDAIELVERTLAGRAVGVGK